MKKQLSIFLILGFPLMALAAGNHSGSHAGAEGAHHAPVSAADHGHGDNHDAPAGDHDKPMSEEMGMSHGKPMPESGAHDHGAMAHDHGAGAVESKMLGRPGDPLRVGRVIDVVMDDSMRFTPSSLTVRPGETIRFFLRNDGEQQHEMVIGPMAELKAHAAAMRKQPHMQHAEPNMASLKPGQRGAIVWYFDRPGTIEFACLVPGHSESGMVGKITVQ